MPRAAVSPEPEVSSLAAGDEAVLESVAPGVFDGPVQPARVRELMADPRHHLVVARQAGQVVGFASGVHYVHPDKPPELWIAEVGVAEGHRRRGLGLKLVRALLDEARAVGCVEAWVLSEADNVAASALYDAAGATAARAVLMRSFPLTPGAVSRP